MLLILFIHRLLNTLKICNWIIHLDDATKTFKAMAKALKSSTISHIKIDGISVLDRNKKHRVEPQFLHALLSSVPLFVWKNGLLDKVVTAVMVGPAMARS